MIRTRRTLLRSCGAGLAATLAGCSGGAGGASPVESTTDVTMMNSQFDPRNIAVDAGATVTWTNEDGTSHTVTNASDNWEMDETVQGGGQTSHAFGSDGVYDVYCRFHGSSDLSGMSMKIAVGDATIESPLGSTRGGGY